MPNERDEGLAALQNSDFQTAQAKLEAAIQQNPSDGMAHLFLGGVYHQLGRHLDAVQALTRAAELQPTNAQARYNLGIVLEHLGAADQAQAAYQQALALQPDYPLAQQGLERTKQATPPAPAYAPVQPTAAYAPNAAQPAYQPQQTQAAPPYAAQPTQQQPAYGQPNYAQPPAYGQQPQQPAYGQAMNQPTDLAGNPLPNAQPAYGQAPMGYAPPPGASGPAGYQGQQWSPQAMQPMVKADAFSLKQAFSDWGQILIAPGRFFESEEGASGFLAPMSQIVAYVLVASVISLIGNVLSGNGSILKVLIGIPIGLIVYPIIWAIWAAINHGISRPFGGSGDYSGSFRATAYSAAPFITLASLGGLLLTMTMPKTLQTSMVDPQVRVMRAQYSTNRYNQPSFGRPNYGQPSYGSPGGMNGSPYGSPYGNMYGRNPFAMSPAMPVFLLLVFGGMIWSIILMARGLSATQHMTMGAAAITVVLSIVVIGVLFFVLSIALGAAIAGMFGAAMH